MTCASRYPLQSAEMHDNGMSMGLFHVVPIKGEVRLIFNYKILTTFHTGSSTSKVLVNIEFRLSGLGLLIQLHKLGHFNQGDWMKLEAVAAYRPICAADALYGLDLKWG